MKVLSIELQDVGCFQHFKADLSGQLVALIGQNGTGKSTILSSLLYAATGDAGRLGGKDAAANSRGSPNQPFSRMTFVPETGSSPAVVTRWCADGTRPPKRKLVFDNNSYTAQADLEELFEKWTGLRPAVMENFVFNEQGEIDRVVRDQPAKRAETLSKLFGLDRAEDARTAIDKHLSGLPIPPNEDVVAMLRTKLAEARASLEVAQKEINSIPVISEDAVSKANSVISAWKKHDAISREVSRLRNDVERCEATLSSPPAVAPNHDEMVTATFILDQWRTYKLKLSVSEKIKSKLLTKSEKLAKLTDNPVLPPGDRPTVPDELQRLRDKKFAYSTVASAPGHDSSCPVCGGVLSPDLADRETANKRLCTLEDLEESWEKVCREYGRQVTLFDGYTATIKTVTEELVEVQRELEVAERELGAPPAVLEGFARSVIDSYGRDKLAYDTDTRIRTKAAVEMENARARLGEISEATVLPPGEFEYETATTFVDSSYESKSHRMMLQSRIDALEETVTSIDDSIKKTEAIQDRADHLRPWRNKLLAVKDLLHYKAAPALAVSSCMSSLSWDLNNRLSHLNAAFRVDLSEDGKMLACFHDGTQTSKVRAERISGGQRAVLGLAWRLAVLDRYAPKVGLLCLDEPTHGLDAERVAALSSALEAWRPHGSDRQFIVVTHEKKILKAFDKVIDLNRSKDSV